MSYGVAPYLVDFARLRNAVTPGVSGYALEAYCKRLGKSLDNDGWSGMHGDWFDAVDAALKKAGSRLELTAYFWAGAPVKIKPPEDFPVVGHVEPKQVATLLEALKQVPRAAQPSKDFVIPEVLLPGMYALKKGRFGSWCLDWTGDTIREHTGIRSGKKQKFRDPQAAGAEARKKIEYHLKRGWEVTPGAMEAFFPKPPRELRNGRYTFNKGKAEWSIGLFGKNLDLDEGGTKSFPDADKARTAATKLILAKLKEGFAPDADARKHMPAELGKKKPASRKPTPLEGDVAVAVAQFERWLEQAARAKQGLVLFYY